MVDNPEQMNYFTTLNLTHGMHRGQVAFNTPGTTVPSEAGIVQSKI